ncbi:carbohydrate ABC transporter permease [Parenemella sanctibonifatiensis]|uniref:ABC transporter permease n=1 Tax=Parenemella sanctibonifatiensis TaxID=2016505 RepID=A0A255EGD0_9ACTN|nr:carbohydrate ABC transporter permease [Parenemella sanctibonifatiensis]OYN90320.1 ABC transporter permease [Parenemella sanctibonifatiensis]
MNTIRRIVLVILGLIWLAPVYLMLANASKSPQQYGELNVWQPGDLAGLAGNFAEAWDRGRISDGILSTALYATIGPALAVVIGAMAGFAIVSLRLKHGFAWFVLIFCSTVFPIQMVLMPLFIGYVEVDIFDTRLGLVLVYTVISVPFSAFVMRNFLSGIGHSTFEAAALDGASSWTIFWRIYMPMSTSALVAIFILQATFVWNDLLLGLTLSQSEAVRPVMPALSALQSTYGGATMPVVLAGGLLVSLPTIVLFMATQRYFSKGLALGQ